VRAVGSDIRPRNHPQEKVYVTTTADHYDPAPGAATAYDTPLGITNPPIDELLDRVSSKYALVIYAAKRARQINDYYNQLGDGILEYVGPLVEPGLQEKPLSIALREIHGDLLEHTEGE
jgi:DNA-directed RNA polymerase subunit omega